jgi:hypothetical protein
MLSAFWGQLESTMKLHPIQASIGGGIGEITDNIWDVINDYVRGVETNDVEVVDAQDISRVLHQITSLLSKKKPPVTGPLLLSQSRHCVLHNVETPMVRLGYSEQWVDIEPKGMFWWEKALMEPYAGSKKVRFVNIDAND